MKNSTIVRIFTEATAAIALLLAIFVWPVPFLISAKDITAVLVGGLVVIGISLVVILYVNWRIHVISEAQKKKSSF